MGDDITAYDFVVVGSGAASICAALMAKQASMRPLIVEKQSVVGGSTAFSGGILWIPNNHHLASIGVNDSFERAKLYLDTLIGDVGLASSPQRREAFLRTGPEMVTFLEHFGMRFVHAEWPDYYSDKPGGLARGRSLVSPLFNINKLGEWAARLAHFAMWSPIPMNSNEAAALSLAKRTWAGKVMGLRVAARFLRKKLTGEDLRGSGGALQGRLLQIALREKIPIWTDAPVQELIVDDGRVVGVNIKRDGRPVRLLADRGVLVNAGGFSHNESMRTQYQRKPASVMWTTANPGDTGELIEMVMQLGADVALMDESWWVPGSFLSDGSFAGFNVPGDTGKPHCIVVNAQGKRFGNEAGAYMEFGQRMYANDAVPAWAIFDSRHRNFYPWGMNPPGITPAKLLENGYFNRADTLVELAVMCRIDPTELSSTVSKFNDFARTGVDEEFQRGDSVYDRYYGDPTIDPNPCLGAIEKAPFYAVSIYPSDVGTCGGLLTDDHARVLKPDGSAIPGLYAAGNCTASVMGRTYPGAGASIAASMIFGYLAAKHAGAH